MDERIKSQIASKIAQKHEKDVERAYKLGLLHGMNVQALATAKVSVMQPDDFDWQLGEDKTGGPNDG